MGTTLAQRRAIEAHGEHCRVSHYGALVRAAITIGVLRRDAGPILRKRASNLVRMRIERACGFHAKNGDACEF